MALRWGTALLCVGLLGCQTSASTTPRSAWSTLDAPQHAKGHSWHVNGAGQVTLMLSNPRSGEALCAVVQGPWRGGGLDIPCVGLAPESDVVTSSTTHAHLLHAGVGLDRWVGCNSLNYLAEGPVLQYATQNEVVDVAGDGGWNVERMEALSPGLVLGSPAYDLSTRGWPMVPITEYLEAHPLGRAEWMVPLAWMMGDSSAGAQAFAGVRDRYEALVGQRMEGAKAPKVLMGSVADGVWYAPGQNTFVARWVEDAGGQYALTAEDVDSNVALGLEQVLEHAAHCDLWMMVVHDPDSFTVSDLLAQDPKHQALLEATDEVWVCNTAKHDYFGALVVQPELILEDLRSAMQLGQVGPHGTFQPLSPP